MKMGEALGAILGISGLAFAIYQFRPREAPATEIVAKTISYSYGIDSIWGLPDLTTVSFGTNGR
jgi:hypothetical protein